MRIVRKSLFFCIMLMLVSQSLLMPSWGLKSSSAAGPVTVVTSQAGYSKEDFKVGSVISDHLLQDETYQVTQNGSQVVYTDTLTYEGLIWGKHVYTFDFSPLELTGDHFKVESNGEASYEFSIEDNIWLQYRDEMTAYYRVQRASVDTADVLPSSYTDTPLSPEAHHDAGHLDDGWDRDGVFSVWDITLDDGTQPTQGLHYDLTGGHYDAGDYGKYAGNQWVGGQLALAYVRHSQSPAVQFDNDHNGVPDIIEEARVNAEYTLKFVDQFDGALFDIPRKGGFQHPILETDGVPLSPAGNPDDREIGQLSVGGTAKAAGMMAATARAYSIWKASEQINDPDVDNFISRSTAGAIKSYEFAYNNQDKNEGKGYTTNDLTNPLLWAEVELYLLTNDPVYYDRAVDRIALVEESQIRNTGYWDVRPIALADFYPVADASTQAKIQQLLKAEVDRFISSADDTPYGVINEFSNFGVNEPHLSMVGDALRYYELFGDPEVLTAVKKGLYWVFGNNPWNISWVSGIGENHVQFPHSRFDQDAYSGTNTGIILPGAMVSGPTIKDPANRASGPTPWYEDRSLAQDGTAQWRYNEHSVSIQAGLFYSIMALAALDEESTVQPDYPQMPILSPQTGDYVTGDVDIIVAAEPGVSNVKYGSTALQSSNGAWTSSFNVDGYRPYDNRRLQVTGEIDGGQTTINSSVHYSVAPPLPSPGTPLLYDGFDKDGTFGYQNLGWQNWYTQNGSKDGSYSKETIDGRAVGKFTHNPSTPTAQAKFQPWHDKVNWLGYRYLYVTLKNSGSHPGLQYRIQVSGKNATSYTTASTNWTTVKIDLDQISGLNKENAQLAIWLQGGTSSGDIYIDEIYVGNDASGSAPTLTALQVDQSSGDEDTVFQFSVTYTDADNDLPHAVQLITDGVVHEMSEADAADVNVTDGKQYVWSSTMVLGAHEYYARTTDTTSAIVQTAVLSGPVVSTTNTGTPPASDARHLGQFAANVNERKAAANWPGSTTLTPDGFGKMWRSGKATWSVHVPVSGTYDFTAHIYGEGTNSTYQVKVDGQVVAGGGLVNSWTDYTGSLGTLTAGTHTVEVVNNSPSTGGNTYVAHIDIAGAAPGHFSLMSPTNNESLSTSSVMLDWTQVIGGLSYAPFGADDYTVVVADNAGLTNPIVDTTVAATTHQVSGLQSNTTYYWQVTANNVNGATPSNAVFSFTTPGSGQEPVQEPEPGLVEARYLGQYASNVNERKSAANWPGSSTATPDGFGKLWRSGKATWSVHMPVSGEYTFTAHIYGEGTDSTYQVKVDGQVVASGALVNSWTDYTGSLGTLTVGTHTIEVVNNSPSTGGNIYVAHTDILGAAPGHFSLMSPMNSATVSATTVTLEWTQAISSLSFAPFGSDDYTVVVADNAALTNPIVNTTVTGTTHQVNSLQDNTTYYWQVTANNDNGSTSSDAVFSFTVSVP